MESPRVCLLLQCTCSVEHKNRGVKFYPRDTHALANVPPVRHCSRARTRQAERPQVIGRIQYGETSSINVCARLPLTITRRPIDPVQHRPARSTCGARKMFSVFPIARPRFPVKRGGGGGSGLIERAYRRCATVNTTKQRNVRLCARAGGRHMY